ncbi:MAG: 2-dehydropantoate 2-reductase [Chloroflexi bacterium]|nr:2-dehydropantoate 2-reductase [Chloroflexota bacterium]
MGSASLLIIGTGALAGLFAARLAAAGHAVGMVGTWAAALDALQTHGVRLVDLDGRERAYPVRVFRRPEPGHGFAGALVLVKSWQTERAARVAAAMLPPSASVLTLQNGLGPQDVLRAALGPQRVVVGVTTYAARVLEPGRVQATGQGTVDLARHAAADFWQAVLAGAGFAVRLHGDVQGLIWGKLAVNAAINPLTALLDVPNGALLEDPAARLFMARAATEVARVAAALGVRLPFPDPVQAAVEVARRTAANSSSMRQDLRRGAPTEIDAICGAVVRAGQQVGQPAPLNAALLDMVREAVARRRDARPTDIQPGP